MSEKTLETVGILPDTEVHMLPFRTFEYRKGEPGVHFPTDLLVTAVPPKLWPFVIRISLRLRNRPGALGAATKFIRDQNINIIFAETTRSGHHHAALNVIGDIADLKNATFSEMLLNIKKWRNRREKLYEVIYQKMYGSEAFKEGPIEKVDKFLPQISDEGVAFESPWWWPAAEAYLEATKKADKSDRSKDYKKRIEKHVEKIQEYIEEGQNKEGFISSFVDASFEPPEKRQSRDVYTPEASQRLVEFVGAIMAVLYTEDSQEKTLLDFLDLDIARARPCIKKINADLLKGVSRKRTYHRVEEEMLPLRILLDAIITYKRSLCEIFKLEMIANCLQPPKESKEPYLEQETTPSWVYLYNIQYYEHVIKHPFFSERAILNSLYTDKKYAKLMKTIINGLASLPPDRRKIRGADRRIDLDPVLITPVEPFCHAYYHRAYEREFSTFAKKGQVPFPKKTDPDYPKVFIESILPSEKSATVAVTSISSDDLTLRLCPLQISSLKRFVEIELDQYKRDSIDTIFDEGIKEREGTSIGLLHEFVSSLRIYDPRPSDTSEHELNIWRLYNKTFELSDSQESGSVLVLAQATDQNFEGFPDNIDQYFVEKFRGKVADNLVGQNVSINSIRVKHISGGRVFVSMPFSHPMRDKWRSCIARIGSSFGFDADTVETFTQQVTPVVGQRIKESHAMMQILALPVERENEAKATKNGESMIWLHAEYLTAVTNGLKVVRLIDECSIDEQKLNIGRDHPNFVFSIMEPFNEFEKQVRLAFVHLRRELSDILGMGRDDFS